jgi:hypothetical protein
MWKASPIHWTSRSYHVEDEGTAVGVLAFGGWGHGAIELDGRRLTVQRERFWSPQFHLMDGSKRLATACPLGAFQRGFRVGHGDEELVLVPPSAFTRSFHLMLRGRSLGQIRSLGVFSRQAAIELDAELAPELRLFAAWLVLCAWRGAAAAAAATT